jgi:hypothetical protein
MLYAIKSKILIMQKICLTIFISLTLFSIAEAQEKIIYPKLITIIDSLFTVDQQVQQDFVEVLINRSSKDSIKMFSDRKEETFVRHIPILKSIFKKYGYPTFEKVGQETSSRFFTLIQHSDADVSFQSEMLKILKKQVAKKQVKGSDYAFLYDRVQINSGKQQLYGTQVEYDENGNAYSKNLKDKKNANKSRAALGMETLESYLEMVTEFHKKQNRIN